MATFTGTIANETITPTLLSPTVNSSSGAPPGAAADTINAGGGNDTLDGGGGSDMLFGDAGNDRMIWNVGGGTDLMEGGADVDTAEVNGGTGSEVFTITANGTRVRFDRLDPSPFSLDIGTTENLVLNAGGGNDSVSATGNLAALIAITINGGAGNDTILGSNGADLLFGGDDNDFIDGQQGSDIAFLGAGNDVFQWDPGDGNDTIEGQAGTDTLLFNGSGGAEIFAISANGQRGLLTRNLGNIVMDTDDVERINLNALGLNDTITVNDLTGTDITQVNLDLAGTIGGATGDLAVDTVIVNGGAGNNAISVRTGVGVATLAVTNAEAADTFTVNGLAGNDTITVSAFAHALVIDGGNDSDTVSYAGAAGAVTASLVDSASNTGIATGHAYTSIENLTGSAFNDFLTGNTGANVLSGGGGNDYLFGRESNDTYVVDGGDVVIEFAGQGTADLVMASTSYVLVAPAHVETLTTTNVAGAAAINLTGNNFVQTIIGNAGANRLDGKGGADTMLGRGGNDTYFVDNAGDVVTETSSNGSDRVIVTAGISYTLDAGSHVEELRTSGSTSTYNVNLHGNNLMNTVQGNNGSNVLSGGLRDDVLTGFGGNDKFRFNSVLSSSNIDEITDYNVAADTIQIDNAVFAGLSSGTLSAARFHIGSAAADSNDRIIYNSATGALIFDSNGSASGGARQFATLDTGLALTNADIVVI